MQWQRTDEPDTPASGSLLLDGFTRVERNGGRLTVHARRAGDAGGNLQELVLDAADEDGGAAWETTLRQARRVRLAGEPPPDAEVEIEEGTAPTPRERQRAARQKLGELAGFALEQSTKLTPTDEGFFASTGSTAQTACSPGTVAPRTSTGACNQCAAGTYQDKPGKLECRPCEARVLAMLFGDADASGGVSSRSKINTSVTSIDVSKNALGNAACYHLVLTLKELDQMKLIGLANCSVPPDAVRILTEFIRVSGQLTTLNLKGNALSNEAVKQLNAANSSRPSKIDIQLGATTTSGPVTQRLALTTH